MLYKNTEIQNADHNPMNRNEFPIGHIIRAADQLPGRWAAGVTGAIAAEPAGLATCYCGARNRASTSFGLTSPLR